MNSQEEQQTISIADWFKRLKASEEVMTAEFKPKYELARRRLRSELNKKQARGGNPTHKQVNLVYSIGTNYINSVIFKNPDVNLTARNDNETEQIENTEIQINDFLKDKTIKRVAKRTEWDAYLGGLGAVYVDYEYSDYQTETQIGTDEAGQPLNQRVITKNAPFIKRIRPDLLRFPKGINLEEYKESPWLGFDMILPIDEVKNDPTLNPDVKNALKGNSYENLSKVSNQTSQKQTSEDKFVKVHYVFQKPKEEGQPYTMMVLSSEVKTDYLMAPTEFKKGHVGYPIHILMHNPTDDDCAYPNGDPWIWEAQLSAIDLWFAKYEDQVNRSNPKNIINSGAIEGKADETISKLKSNNNQEWIGIKTKNGQPIQNVILKHESADVHPSVTEFYNTSRNLLSELAPKSNISRGAADQPDETATRDKIRASNELVDLDARADDIREWWIDIVKDIAGLYEQNFQGVTTIKGKLPDGRDINREVDQSGFTSNINCDIDVDSMKQQNRELYRAQLMEAIQTLKLVEPDFNKKGKAIDFEFFAQKLVDGLGIRGADKAIIDLNLRAPSKEHEDFAFGNVPMELQDGEPNEQHLLEHYTTQQDPKKMAFYTQANPQFPQMLDAHLAMHADKQEKLKAQTQAQPKVQPTKEKVFA